MTNKKSTHLDEGGLAQLDRMHKVTPPPMYSVWLLNDDYTPMEFVVEVLEQIFNKNHDEAELIMMKVHTAGRAVCGEYPRDIAETKVMKVSRLARKHGHPLQCALEKK